MAANSQLASAVTNPLAAAQYANTYGPQTQQAIRRSQYLADALRQNLDGGQQIKGGWGELGARLLATAVLQRANDKGQDALIKALGADQQSETDRLLGSLGPAPGAAPPTFMPQAPPSAPQPQDPGMSVPSAQTPQPASAPNMSDADRLNIARAVYGEARGEPQAGQQAVASVILNRARASGKSPSDVVAAPHQFSGYNPQTQGLTPEQLQQISANIDPVLTGATPDATNGADHFFNPALANPSWGQGNGQLIGQHKFMRLDDQGHAAPPQMAAAPPQAPPQAPPPEPQPYQVASNGPTPPPPQPPSAPGSSPPGAGTLPAAPPQAAAAGSTPTQPQWPTWKPSQDEYHYVQGLLTDPRTHAQGVQAAMQMRQKMTQPVASKIVTMNGVSFYVPDEPGAAPTLAIPVPTEARTRTQSAQEAGIAAPPGTTFDTDPLGNHKQVYQPQNGQMITSAANQPYSEAPIPGGTNDPRAPAARFSNEGKLRDDYAKEISPYVAAREGYQKVVQAAGDMSQAGAIAMVFGYMKTLDPTSTVREGEQASVQNSGTIPQTITNMYNKLIAGQSSLTPAQREEFANSAKGQFDVYQHTFDAANQRYSGLASSYGMDPRNVVRAFNPIEPYHPPGPQGGVPAAARNAYVGLYQQGKIDTSKPDGHALHPMIAVSPEALRGMDIPANRGKHVITPDGHLAVIE